MKHNFRVALAKQNGVRATLEDMALLDVSDEELKRR